MLYIYDPNTRHALAVWDEEPEVFTVEVASGLHAICDRSSPPRSSPRIVGYELAFWKLANAETAAAYRRIIELLERGDDTEMSLSEVMTGTEHG